MGWRRGGRFITTEMQGCDKDYLTCLAAVPEGEARALWDSGSSTHRARVSEVAGKGRALSLRSAAVDEDTHRVSAQGGPVRARDTEGKFRWVNR